MSETEKELKSALLSALRVIEHVRYSYWQQIGLGIGLEPARLDDVLRAGQRALRKANRRKKSSAQ